MRKGSLLLVTGVVALVAGCGGSSSTTKMPKGSPRAIADGFINNVLTGYLDDAESDLSPVSGVDVRSLTDLSIGLQSGHFHLVGEAKEWRHNVFVYQLDGRQRGDSVRLTYEVGVDAEAGDWMVTGFKLVKQARPVKMS